MPNEPADPLLPADPPEPVVVVAPGPGIGRPKHVICDFCQCKLAMDGGVLETGTRARTLAKHEDTIAARDAEIESLRSQLTSCQGELSALKAATQEKTGSGRNRY